MIDFNKAHILLEIIHNCIDLPDMRWLRDSAQAELRAMAPNYKPVSDAESLAPISPQFDPSGKPLESTPVKRSL